MHSDSHSTEFLEDRKYKQMSVQKNDIQNDYQRNDLTAFVSCGAKCCCFGQVLIQECPNFYSV